MKTLLRAAYIATMAGPVIRDGGVVFDEGGVIAVGEAGAMRALQADAVVVELGDALVLPGLVNAHTHLDLTLVGQLPKQDSFVDWILALRERMMGIGDNDAFVRESVRKGIEQSLRFGVTAVGDITLNPGISRPILGGKEGLRGVSYGEVLGMAERIGQLDTRLGAAIDLFGQTPQLRFGIEAHAPYSIDLAGYERCLEAAKNGAMMPLATHLAETPDEAAFLADHSGPFRRLWETLGAWSEGVGRCAGGPIRAMQKLGVLDYPALLAHVNYVDDEELEILARGKASVVYCPRTHEYFGHRPHRFEEMLARGINVAIGTDSCASSPDLNVVDDLRLVYRTRPHLSPELLWSLVTTRGARALGMEKMVGSIAAGLVGDFCVYKVKTDDPLREVLEGERGPAQVLLAEKQRN